MESRFIFCGPRFWEASLGKWSSLSWWYQGYEYAYPHYRLWIYVRYLFSIGLLPIKGSLFKVRISVFKIK